PRGATDGPRTRRRPSPRRGHRARDGGAPCTAPYEGGATPHAASAVALLLDLGGLPAAIAHVVQLRSPHIAPAHDLDLGDDRRVQRERALHPDTEAELAHREGLTDAPVLAA